MSHKRIALEWPVCSCNKIHIFPRGSLPIKKNGSPWPFSPWPLCSQVKIAGAFAFNVSSLRLPTCRCETKRKVTLFYWQIKKKKHTIPLTSHIRLNDVLREFLWEHTRIHTREERERDRRRRREREDMCIFRKNTLAIPVSSICETQRQRKLDKLTIPNVMPTSFQREWYYKQGLSGRERDLHNKTTLSCFWKIISDHLQIVLEC